MDTYTKTHKITCAPKHKHTHTHKLTHSCLLTLTTIYTNVDKQNGRKIYLTIAIHKYI